MAAALTKVSVLCQMCGAEFLRPAWRVRQIAARGGKSYCGYACSRAARRVHTPESKAEYHRAYRANNRELIREKQRAERQGDRRPHVLARDRIIYRRNIETNRRLAREYASAHREQAIARRKAWPEKNPKRYEFHIVRSNIAASVGIPSRFVPDELVDARLDYLKLYRAVRAASGILTEGGDVKQAPGASLSSPAPKGGRP